MRYVYDPSHLLHNPDTEVQFGVTIGMLELPARAEGIRRALAADPLFESASPTEHGESLEGVARLRSGRSRHLPRPRPASIAP